MARIRSIKPDFFTSETIARLPMFDRLLFIGLWTHVDDNGVCVDNPALVRAALFPLDEQITSRDVDETLMRLSGESLVTRYVVDGKRYLGVRSWSEHQKVQHPGKERYPTADQAQEIRTTLSRHSHENLTPEQGAGSREQGAGITTAAAETSTSMELVLTTAVAAAPAARARDVVFDALCTACGWNPLEVTGASARTVGVAAASIRKAWSGETADLPAEIDRRRNAYVRIYSHAALTPHALAKHWAGLNDQAVAMANPDTRQQFARAAAPNRLDRLRER
jgi:hypothetical protein